jgi:acid phosphatase
MKRLLLLIISVVMLSACTSGIINLSKAQKDVIDYYESGQYDKEMDEIIDGAIKKLEKLKIDQNSAVVFDIDETSLSNYPHMKEMGFGSVDALWDEWTKSAKAKAIPQTKKLYDRLVAKGVKIFFITGRYDGYYDATRKNLINAGYTKIDTLICKGKEEFNKSAAQYKSFHRAELTGKGINIIANIGDQWSDSEGGNSGLIIKLPNYIYILE